MGLVDIDMLRSGPVLKDKDTGDVSKFLNRILGLSVEKQNMVSCKVRLYWSVIVTGSLILVQKYHKYIVTSCTFYHYTIMFHLTN
jgi:hypothetical protein